MFLSPPSYVSHIHTHTHTHHNVPQTKSSVLIQKYKDKHILTKSLHRMVLFQYFTLWAMITSLLALSCCCFTHNILQMPLFPQENSWTALKGGANNTCKLTYGAPSQVDLDQRKNNSMSYNASVSSLVKNKELQMYIQTTKEPSLDQKEQKKTNKQTGAPLIQ